MKFLSVDYGDNCNIIGRIKFYREKESNVLIGNNLIFSSGRFVNPISRNIKGAIYISQGATLKIGNNVGISSTSIWVHDSVLICDNVKIGADSIIIDSDCHSLDFRFRRDYLTDVINKANKQIIIDEDVLIGARCIILKGVHVGARTIIGAGSVVTKSIPADCIAAGNPCRVLKKIEINI